MNEPLSHSPAAAGLRDAIRYAPRLLLDRNEPFRPIRLGVTVFERPAPSPSFDRDIRFDPERVRFAIEYAIYWDYDIQHLYDLEHVWVYVGRDGRVAACEASFHGQYLIGLTEDRANVGEDGRVRLFVQPGKHALSPLKELFRLLPNAESCCLEDAGKDGLLEPAMLRGRFKTRDDADDLAAACLQAFRFRPSFEYEPYEWEEDALVPWERLREEIPARMNALLESLAAGREGADARRP